MIGNKLMCHIQAELECVSLRVYILVHLYSIFLA